ncbi:hypothetical protein BS78_05G123000 [Paspalum vaginatum]|nr:hypothetical protein BS78_05G123000 [Paspalum vaginatum]
MADDIPAGYYHGRPMNHHAEAEHSAPPPPAEAVDGQVNAQVPGYYATRVPGRNAVRDQISPPPPPPPPAPAPSHQPSKEPDFFTRCFGCCLSGGGTAR